MEQLGFISPPAQYISSVLHHPYLPQLNRFYDRVYDFYVFNLQNSQCFDGQQRINRNFRIYLL